MNRPIVFRDIDGHVIDAAHGAPLVYVAKRQQDLERLDVWPRGRRQCTVGIAFTDGTTGIGEVPWSAEAVEAWAQARRMGKTLKIHVTKQGA